MAQFVVLKLDTYAGDGCEDRGQYTVSNVYGVFGSEAAAESWIKKQEKGYAVDYEVNEVKEVE